MSVLVNNWIEYRDKLSSSIMYWEKEMKVIIEKIEKGLVLESTLYSLDSVSQIKAYRELEKKDPDKAQEIEIDTYILERKLKILNGILGDLQCKYNDYNNRARKWGPT